MTFKHLAQNPQASTLNLLENKKLIDLLNNNDEYTGEAKKIENVRTSSNAGGEADERAQNCKLRTYGTRKRR